MNIGWITIGNENVGSTRLGVLVHHITLIKNGYNSFLLSVNSEYNPDVLNDIEKIKNDTINKKITHCIFQKVCYTKTQELVKFCKDNNIKTIFATGDWYDTPMFDLVDAIWVGSSYIKEYLSNKYNKPVFVIEDAVEETTTQIKEFKDKPPTIGWYGNYSKLEYVKSFLKDIDTYTISNSQKDSIQADVIMGASTPEPWETKKLIDILLQKIDIIVVPVETENSQMVNFAKTSNRITLPMSLGIPVICSPIPAYKEIIEDGVNGFLCKTYDEYKEKISYLNDIDNRIKIGRHSIEDIKHKFSKEKIMRDILFNLGKI